MPGPIDPITNRGRSGVEKPVATSLARRAACSLMAYVSSAMPYSLSTREKAPKVAVSTASTPASKYSACICWMSSGRVSTRRSLQPSRAGPAEVVRSEILFLDPGAERAVEDEDAFGERGEEFGHSCQGTGGYCPLFDDWPPPALAVPRVGAAAEADGPVGAGPQLAVTGAVAVGPHERWAAVVSFVEVRVEATRLLEPRTFAPSSRPVSRPSSPTSSSVASTASKPSRSAIGRRYTAKRRGHDDQPVSLGAVPVGALDGLGLQVTIDHLGGEAARRGLDRADARARRRAAARLRPSCRCASSGRDRDVPRSRALAAKASAVRRTPGDATEERHEVVPGRERAVEVERGHDVHLLHGPSSLAHRPDALTGNVTVNRP